MDIEGTPPTEPQPITLAELSYSVQLAELPTFAENYMRQQRWQEAILTYQKLVEVLQKHDFAAFFNPERSLQVNIYGHNEAQSIDAAETANHNHENEGNEVEQSSDRGVADSAYTDPDNPNKTDNLELAKLEIYSNACCGLGVALSKLNQLSEAIASYQKALAVNPEDRNALYLAGVAYGKRHQWEAAIDCYQKLISLQPDHLPALMNLGVLLLRSGDHAEAVTQFSQLLEITPNSSDVHCNLGIAYYRQGNLADAATSLGRAIALNPNNIQALYNLGKVAEAQDQPEAAIAYYRQALSIDADDVDTCCALAFVLDRQNQSEAAIALYQHALSLNPNDVDTLSNLGTSLVHQKNPQAAIAYFERALSLRRSHLAANLNLAHACFMIGEFAKGFEYYRWRWYLINQPKRSLLASKPRCGMVHHWQEKPF
jgi:tetratricopeptide (TPR) repeat protein